MQMQALSIHDFCLLNSFSCLSTLVLLSNDSSMCEINDPISQFSPSKFTCAAWTLIDSECKWARTMGFNTCGDGRFRRALHIYILNHNHFQLERCKILVVDFPTTGLWLACRFGASKSKETKYFSRLLLVCTSRRPCCLVTLLQTKNPCWKTWEQV